jgi:PAS domain S-box-containing protein
VELNTLPLNRRSGTSCLAITSPLLLHCRCLSSDCQISLRRTGVEANLVLVGADLLFLVPLLLNNRGLIQTSRYFLSWVPSLCAIVIGIVIIKSGNKIETSDFVGNRFFLLGLACIPFLIFNVKRPRTLLVALAGSVAPLLFYDVIMNFLHIGYRDLGLTDSTYDYNLVRVMITFFIIGLSFYFLKRIVENQEILNEKLVNELEHKSQFIQQHANDEVYQLNEQLKLNFQQLSEREFILNESQRIAKIGSWEYHIQNAFLFWSDEMYAIFGLEKELNLKTSDMIEALGKEGSETITNATIKLFRTNQPFDTIIRTKTPLGYTKWFRVYAFPILASGNAIGVRGICHDITFFKEAEEKLKSSEAKFSKVFENYPDFIMVVRESDLIVADVNQRVKSVLGFEKEEVIGRSAREMDLFLNEEERQRYIWEYNIEGYTDYECTWKRKDGRIIQVMITGIRVDIEGQYYRMSVVRDITEIRQVEREKELAQANLTATINNTEVLIWSVDRQLNLITFNTPFFESIKKNSGVEVKIGSNVFDPLITPEGQEIKANWIKNYTRALAGEVVTLEESSFGTHFQFSLSPIIEDNIITGVSVFADNVTELNASNRELAEANKKISELKLMALRSVMSPHFIFNVLNSIQFFIAKNDRLNAINYLSTFSKLIRSVLTHSITNKIKLSDEIELLRNYVHLEMTRFESKFDFVLNVNSDIDADSFELPSLLIQPYVENAILHGLYNKPEKGRLTIKIDEEDEHLIFKIEDNGIGRAEAMKLREKNFPAHKSMGIKVTEERLKLINQQNIAGFEIEDLTLNGEPCGTRVIIKIAIS